MATSSFWKSKNELRWFAIKHVSGRRDCKGNIIRAGSTHYNYTSIILEKVRVLRDGVQVEHTSGFKNFIIEVDNLVIIKALLGMTSTPWQISNIIRDVRYWLDQSAQLVIRNMYRAANMAED